MKDKDKKQKSTKAENNHTCTVTVQINLNVSISVNGKWLEKMFKTLQKRFGVIFGGITCTNFDGEAQTGTSVYQLSGTPIDIVKALRQIDEILGEDAIDSVRYISKTKHFDRSNLTLQQAIRIAENEGRL